MLQYFTILGLPPQASINDIKTAYRKLALVYHPDRNPESLDAPQKFRAITEAYQILSEWKQQQLQNEAKNSSNHSTSSSNKTKQNFYEYPHYQASNLKYQRKKVDEVAEYQRMMEKRMQLNLQYRGNYIVNKQCPYCQSTHLKKVISHTELHGITYIPFFLGIIHCDSCGVDFYGAGKKVSELFMQILSIIAGFIIASVAYYALISNLDSIL
jgi:hypothetical protein